MRDYTVGILCVRTSGLAIQLLPFGDCVAIQLTFLKKMIVKFKPVFIVAPCIMESIYCSLTKKCTFIKLGKV